MNDAFGRPQSVLVLGATSEIAEAVIEALVERGTRRLVLAARDPAALERVADRWRQRGSVSVETLPFEATDTDAHASTIEKAFESGDVDLALLAFGVLGDQRIDEVDPARAVTVIETNFTGAASVGIELVKRMRRQGHGTVVVLSSLAAERARRSNFVYGSAKAGADAFFQGMAAATAGDAVRILIVRPGFVKTRMTAGMKVPPLSTTPDAVARVVVRGLERGSEIVWAPPATRWMMLVLRHLPTALFRKLPI